MERLTQANNQTIFEAEIFFDENSRENYFEMLEVALRNLSIVDRKQENQKAMRRKPSPILSN